MSAPNDSAVTKLARTHEESSALTCCRCGDVLAPDIIFGDLRFYVCRPCGRWAVPHPPIRFGPTAPPTLSPANATI